MPNRIIKESICTSCEIDSLTAEEERFFYRLIVSCDDFGRMDARPPILRAKCFPLKVDSVASKDIEKWLKRLASVGLVVLYGVDGKEYLQFKTWDKHQHKRAQISKYPGPPGEIPKEHPIASEKDVEDIIHIHLQCANSFLNHNITSIDRQLRNKEVYIDLLVRTEADNYMIEIKRTRLSNKAIDQVLRYSKAIPSKCILIGNGLSGNFDTNRCRENNIAVISYNELFEWSVVCDGGFLTDIEWLPVVEIRRDVTCYHVKTSDAYNREYENTRIENTRNENTEQVFEHLWSLYPKKKGKGQVSPTQKKKLHKIGIEEIERCIERYKLETKNTEDKYIQNGSTFFNSGYIDYLDENYTPKEKMIPDIQSDPEYGAHLSMNQRRARERMNNG